MSSALCNNLASKHAIQLFYNSTPDVVKVEGTSAEVRNNVEIGFWIANVQVDN